MEIIPAIDLREGVCVRLLDEDECKKDIYSDDPIIQAQILEKAGVRTIHITDLDAAFVGVPCHMEVIRQILEKTNLAVQVSGGIRTMDSLDQLMDLGVDRIVLTTAAVRNPQMVEDAVKKYGDHIVIGLDSHDGYAAIEGFESILERKISDVASDMKNKGAQRMIYTDLRRDGSLKGPNYQALRELSLLLQGTPLIASGGIYSLDCIRNLKAMNLEAVIVGKAIYIGLLNLSEMIKIAQ